MMIEAEDEDILLEICWALYNLIDQDPSKVPDLQHEDVIVKLLQNFKLEANIAIIAPSMRIIGNMLTGP